MSDVNSVITDDDMMVLANLASSAASLGWVTKAEVICRALRRMRPDRAMPFVSMAMCYLNAGRPVDAVRLLESASGVRPQERDEVDAILGLSLQFAGRASESRKALEAVLARQATTAASGVESPSVELARGLLGLDSKTLSRLAGDS